MSASFGNTDVVLIATTTNAVLQALGGNQLVFLKMTACNTDTVAHTVTVWRAPSGGSVATGEILWDAQSVPPGKTVVLPFSGKSLVNQQLFASADTPAVVNLSIDYMVPG